MPPLSIRLKKHPDGSASLACVRADGSVTWQNQKGKLGTFFPPHDLTHYAVETVLDVRRAFYGLVADGWDIGDFSAPWPRGLLPAEAGEVEGIVGVLDLERRLGAPLTAEAFAEQRRMQAEAIGAKGKAPLAVTHHLTQAELMAIRTRRDDLIAQWQALPSGETMELAFG